MFVFFDEKMNTQRTLYRLYNVNNKGKKIYIINVRCLQEKYGNNHKKYHTIYFIHIITVIL